MPVKPPRKAPNKRIPPRRPTDPIVLQKVKDHLRAEYEWLKQNELETERNRKKAVAAQGFADIDARKIFEPIYQRMQQGMKELYSIIGRSKEEIARRQEQQIQSSTLFEKLPKEGAEPWPVVLEQKNTTPPDGKTIRGDPNSPKNLILNLGLNFLYIEEIAEVMNVTEGAIRTFMSQSW